MTATPFPEQSAGMRRPRHLIIPIAVVIGATAMLMLVLNLPAVAPIGVLVLAAILVFAWLSRAKKS